MPAGCRALRVQSRAAEPTCPSQCRKLDPRGETPTPRSPSHHGAGEGCQSTGDSTMRSEHLRKPPERRRYHQPHQSTGNAPNRKGYISKPTLHQIPSCSQARTLGPCGGNPEARSPGHPSAGDGASRDGAPAMPQPPKTHQHVCFSSAPPRLAVRLSHLRTHPFSKQAPPAKTWRPTAAVGIQRLAHQAIVERARAARAPAIASSRESTCDGTKPIRVSAAPQPSRPFTLHQVISGSLFEPGVAKPTVPLSRLPQPGPRARPPR